MFKSIYRRVFKQTFNRILNNDNYIRGFPQLKNSAFSNLSQTWINHNIEILDYNESENLVYIKKDNLYLVTTPDYPYIIHEIFCSNIYFINPLLLKSTEYLVFDMGMNRGYASLYFASQTWCKSVYGFELNENIYKMAQKNLDLNRGLKAKIDTYSFGLGSKEEKIRTYYLPRRDGICTTSKDFLSNYAPEELNHVIEAECLIKKSSLVVKEIADRNRDMSIIVKIDVEGAEYDIINDIVTEYPSFFNKVDIIIGEAHLGLEPLVDALKPFGYIEVSKKKLNPKTQDFLFIKN